MKPKSTLDDRIKQSVGKHSAPSMVPDFTPPPPPKEEEIIPDVRELINSAKDRLKLAQLVEQSSAWGVQEKEAKKMRAPLTAAIKKILGEYEVGRAMCDGKLINYYNAPRSTLSRELLLSHGISPQVLEACTVTKDSYTLRISAPGESEED